MGRKQARAGKYIYFCIACLIFFTLSSCNGLKETKQEEKRFKAVSEYLVFAKKMLEQGNYEASVEENQKVLSLSHNGPPGDEALFSMGLIYAHFGNPRKDYEKSIFFFRKLLKEYPKSPLVEHAKIWIGVLNVIEKSKQVDIEIEEMKKELSR